MQKVDNKNGADEFILKKCLNYKKSPALVLSIERYHVL
jgi:hypothetical protein